MPQAKTEVALQFSECCTAETALQHWLFCSAEVIWTRSCAAANEELHCNIEKAALQESGAFLPLSCGFQAPTFRHPRLGPTEHNCAIAPEITPQGWLRAINCKNSAHLWEKNSSKGVSHTQCFWMEASDLSCEVIIWSKFGGFKCYYLVQVFFKNTDCQKQQYKNRGFSPCFFWKNELHAKNLNVIIWSKLAFLKTHPTWTR